MSRDPVRRSVLAPLVALFLLSGALTGCFGGKNPDAHCDDVAEYQASRSVPDIVAPDGLVTPTLESGYSVPAPTANAEADLLVRGAACLARPPDYFKKDPAVAPAK